MDCFVLILGDLEGFHERKTSWNKRNVNKKEQHGSRNIGSLKFRTTESMNFGSFGPSRRKNSKTDVTSMA